MERSSKYSAVNRVFNGLLIFQPICFPSLLYFNRLSSSNPSPSTVFKFMLTYFDTYFIPLCLEWFLYGTILISVLCALTSTLAKEIQLFPGPGLYSGIFAIYLQCPKKESRTAMIIFYVLSSLCSIDCYCCL